MASHNDPEPARSGDPMIPLPKWATLRLQKFSCSVCGRTQRHTDIVATGIRAGPNGCGVFFLESVCGHCRSPSVCMFAGMPFDPQTFAIGLTLAHRNGRAAMKPIDGSMFENWTDHANEAVADELESLDSHDESCERSVSRRRRSRSGRPIAACRRTTARNKIRIPQRSNGAGSGKNSHHDGELNLHRPRHDWPVRAEVVAARDSADRDHTSAHGA